MHVTSYHENVRRLHLPRAPRVFPGSREAGDTSFISQRLKTGVKSREFEPDYYDQVSSGFYHKTDA